MRERQLNSKQVQVTAWPSVDRFLEIDEVPQGYLVIRDDGIPIDLFYKSTGSDTTIVCFHGAAPENVRIPWHVGSHVVNYAGANRLSISDPSLQLYEKARNTWFAGSSQMPALQLTLETLIRKIIETTGSQHIVFFGGSSGGFASLYYSLRFPGSLALPMNPQTVLSRHHAPGKRQFFENLWPGITEFDDLPTTVTTDLASLYGQGFQNTVGYIQNTRDSFHINQHRTPFIQAVGKHPSVWSYTGNWGSEDDNGHVQPPRLVVSKLLAEVTGSQGRWDEALEVFGFTPISGSA